MFSTTLFSPLLNTFAISFSFSLSLSLFFICMDCVFYLVVVEVDCTTSNWELFLSSSVSLSLRCYHLVLVFLLHQVNMCECVKCNNVLVCVCVCTLYTTILPSGTLVFWSIGLVTFCIHYWHITVYSVLCIERVYTVIIMNRTFRLCP